MLQPAFHIEHEQPGSDEYLQSLLLMEVNPSGFSYLVLHEVRQEVLDAKYYSIPQNEGRGFTERLRNVIDSDDVLQHQFRETIVLYNYAESVLVPSDHFSLELNRELIDLNFGSLAKGLILSEKVPLHDTYNVYRVTADIHSLFQHKFTAGKYWHIYSLWLASLKSFPAGEYNGDIHALFYPDRMLVSVYRDGRLLLAQTFQYQVAEDVVYYLLNTCRQLDLSPEEVLLSVSGYADNESVLLTEVKKYFMNFYTDEVPPTFSSSVFTPVPVHFFSPLLKMALCV